MGDFAQSVDSLIRRAGVYRHGAEVRTQVVGICSAQSGLEPHLRPISVSAPQSGTTVHNLIALEGNVPTIYKGNSYRIPVSLILPELFPHVAPVLYVVPRPNMFVNDRHPNVMPGGLVRMPYLDNWRPGSSNLFDVLSQAQALFSQQTPLYARPPTQQQQQQQPQMQQHLQRMPMQASPYGMPENPYHGGTPLPPSSLPPSAAAGSEERRSLVASVQAKVRSSLQSIDQEVSKELSMLEAEFFSLETHGAELESLRVAMTADLRALSTRCSALETEIRALEDWQMAHATALQADGDYPPVDEIFRPSADESPLALQALLVEAQVQTSEDVLYYAAMALDHGRVDIETQLRFVREEARKQFFARALLKKIRGLMATSTASSAGASAVATASPTSATLSSTATLSSAATVTATARQVAAASLAVPIYIPAPVPATGPAMSFAHPSKGSHGSATSPQQRVPA